MKMNEKAQPLLLHWWDIKRTNHLRCGVGSVWWYCINGFYIMCMNFFHKVKLLYHTFYLLSSFCALPPFLSTFPSPTQSSSYDTVTVMQTDWNVRNLPTFLLFALVSLQRSFYNFIASSQPENICIALKWEYEKFHYFTTLAFLSFWTHTHQSIHSSPSTHQCIYKIWVWII